MRGLQDRIRARLGIAILDGGMGTGLGEQGLSEAEAWTAGWHLDDPRIETAVVRVYEGFLAAGVDILTANTYNISGASARRAADHQPRNGDNLARRAIRQNIELARRVIERRTEGEAPLLAVSLGSFGTAIPGRGETANRESDNPHRIAGYGVDLAVLETFHRERILAALQVPPHGTEEMIAPDFDLFAFETIPDRLEALAIVNVLRDVFERYRLHDRLDAWVSFTCPDVYTVDNGDLFTDCVRTVANSREITAVGINCTAPHLVSALLSEASSTLRAFSDVPGKLLVCYPNSGERYLARKLREGEAGHWESSDSSVGSTLSDCAGDWIALGCSVIGGCCRITAREIGELRVKIQALD